MELFDVSLFASMLRLVTPIMLAALGGAICARVGLFNVGLEGLMLTGAFSAIVGNYYTGNVWLAVLFAVLCTVIFSMLFAYMSIAVLLCGVLCGLAGAQLSLGNVTMFTEGMTAGRGFIALVATMLGQSNPLGVAASSLLFGLMDALSLRLQGFSLPTHFTMMLPYVVTIVAMLIFKDKSYMQEARKANESSR
ncbi:ABC transporter permease [Paenibacillus sp. MCAF20]